VPLSTDLPVHDRAGLSHLAYGFMASKALFAALELDVFTHLAPRPCTAEEVATAVGVPVNRTRTLLRALAGVGLLTLDGDRYANGPAAGRHLVRGAGDGLGDYFRLQVGRQVYPALVHLDAGMAGTGGADADLFTDPYEARLFTTAQHAGSRGVGRALAASLPLEGTASLLDVGAGSGALSIELCRAFPELRATLVDFPAVLDVARDHVDIAGLAGRIALRPGDAVHTPWPPDQDTVLMSYLLSALGDAEADSEVDSEIDAVLAKAAASLRPGGSLVVHDFLLADDGPGPAGAALWNLQYVAHRPDGVSFTVAELRERLAAHGFTTLAADVVIPDLTTVVLARKALS
jgi:2-hydroxy-4-(methylsulfanyl)butanoate S-methyltransferase